MPAEPLINFSSGYVQRAVDMMPRQGTKAPWRLYQSYLLDLLTLRYSRQLFTNPLKRAFLDELGHGLARETYAQRAFFPFGGEMAPLDRAWDDEPWSTPRNGGQRNEGVPS